MSKFNIWLAFVICAIGGCADSIWMGTVVVSFIYILSGNKNNWVGYIEAANGMSELLFALPVGFLADRFPKARVIRGGSVVTFIAIASSTAVFIMTVKNPSDDRLYLWLLLGSMCLWGISNGFLLGPMQALFADCVPAGARTRNYTILYGCYSVGSAVGPAVSIALFQAYGNQWGLLEMRNVFFGGMALEFVVAVLMLFFKDPPPAATPPPSAVSHEPINASVPAQHDDTLAVSAGEATALLPRPAQGLTNRTFISLRSAPYMLFFSNLVVCLGSGIFFPLYFKENCGLSPSGVQGVYVVAPIFTTLLSVVTSRVSKRYGRVPVIVACNVFGIGCLLALVFAQKHLPRYALLTIFIFRTGLMNSCYPLQESILMDCVPENTRGRWKSLESIASFGWCGSAALGGYLGDHHGYNFTFGITAALQGAGTLFFLPLWRVIPPEQPEQPNADDTKVSRAPPAAATDCEAAASDGRAGSTAPTAAASCGHGEPIGG